MEYSSVFANNPITNKYQEHQKEIIINKFPILRECGHDNYLSIWNFVNDIPYKFYSQNTCNTLYEFLEFVKYNDPAILVKILIEYHDEYNRAIKATEDVNSLNFHDNILTYDEHQLMLFFEEHLNSAYIKIIEAAYSNFILPISAYLRIKRKANLDGFDVYQRVEELKNSQYSYLSNLYKSVIRNGIAHGGVIYRGNSIIYKDKKNTEELFYHDFIKLFDKLIDSTNGLYLGFKLFIIKNLIFLESRNVKIPLSIILSEIKAQIDAPGFKLKAFLESETINNENQLIVFSENEFLDEFKLKYNVFRTAYLLAFFRLNYDRYFVKLQSKYSFPGWAAFNGNKINNAFNNKSVDLKEIINALENNLIFFIPKIKLPRIFYKIGTMITIAKIIIPIEYKNVRMNILPFYINMRTSNIHRNGYRSVLDISVVICCNNGQDVKDIILRYHRYIVRKAIRYAKKNAKVTEPSKYLKAGFVHVNLFSKDFRKRKLKSSGLIPELIARIEVKTIRRIKTIDLLNGEPQIIGKYRIVWNKKPILIE